MPVLAWLGIAANQVQVVDGIGQGPAEIVGQRGGEQFAELLMHPHVGRCAFDDCFVDGTMDDTPFLLPQARLPAKQVHVDLAQHPVFVDDVGQ
jgi:hypothetical protein